MLNWFHSCDSHSESARKTTTDVPQRSILGPLLFIMFSHELPLHVNKRIDLFADDTTLLQSSDNVQDLENNKLPLNCFNTKTILIDGQRLRNRFSSEDRKFEIQINCRKLEQAKSVKLLELELDEHL